jgi:hypothetical protein
MVRTLIPSTALLMVATSQLAGQPLCLSEHEMMPCGLGREYPSCYIFDWTVRKHHDTKPNLNLTLLTKSRDIQFSNTQHTPALYHLYTVIQNTELQANVTCSHARVGQSDAYLSHKSAIVSHCKSSCSATQECTLPLHMNCNCVQHTLTLHCLRPKFQTCTMNRTRQACQLSNQHNATVSPPLLNLPYCMPH